MSTGAETLFTVVLLDAGTNKKETIKKIWELAGLDLNEATQAVEHPPFELCKNISLEKAQKMQQQFSDVGAIVQINAENDTKPAPQTTSAAASFENATPVPANSTSNTTATPTPAPTSYPSTENQGCLYEIKKFFKPIIVAVEILIAVVAIYLFATGNFHIAMTDFLATINSDDINNNPYINMVCTSKPFDNGSTYYQAYVNTFDTNRWEYFKADGVRVVQITSSYKDINEELITQFVVTPTEDKESFQIELYAMNLSGKDLSSYEANIVLAGIFKGDLLNALWSVMF